MGIGIPRSQSRIGMFNLPLKVSSAGSVHPAVPNVLSNGPG